MTTELSARQGRNKRLSLGIPGRRLTSEDATIAGREGKPPGVTSPTVTREGDELVSMYDDQGRRRLIPEGSVRVVLSAGLRLECPFCQGEHETDDPNACPALPKVQYRQCPVCGKRVFDVRGVAEIEDDPLAIPTALANTPEERTKAVLEEHVIAYHRTQARQMGLLRSDQTLPGP